MTVLVQPIVYALPVSSVVSSLRESANDGASLFSFSTSTIGLVIWVMIAFFISIRFFVWKEVAR